MESILDCGSHADLGHADDLRSRLLTGLADSDELILDVSGLVSADLSFVQLIEAARKQAVIEGKAIALSAAAPAPLVTLVEASGLLWARSPEDLQFWFKGEAGQ